VLVLAIVVHGPDFLGSGAVADEEDPRLGDAIDAAAELQNDGVSEAMGDGAGHVLAGGLIVLFSKHLRVTAGVKEPAVDHQVAVFGLERPKGHHLGVRGRGGPLRQVDLLRRARHGLWQHALGHQVEDAGVGQVALERSVEGGLQGRGVRIGGRRFEIGRGQANALVAEVGARVDPVLSLE
jgi:hypothetical protein